MSERTVCDFQRGADWRASKSNNRGSTTTARRLDRDKVMQVRGLRGSENLDTTVNYIIFNFFHCLKPNLWTAVKIRTCTAHRAR